MKGLIFAAAFLTMVGCASVDYTPGKVYRVTGGYIEDSSSHNAGNEFLFSLVPPAGQWGYARGKPWFKTNRGYIRFINTRSQSITFSWHWNNRANLESDIAENPHLAPWLYGAHPTMKRVVYAPTNQQINSGDWSQPGYSQRQWYQFRYIGKNSIYCMTALNKSREEMIQYSTERNIPYNAYSYNIVCPFKLEDGRSASFAIRTTFSIADEQLAQNSNRVEENIEYINKMLGPTWSSLVIMPRAYQFGITMSDKNAP